MIDVAQLTSQLVQIPSVGLEHGELEVCRHLNRLLGALPGAQVRILEPRPRRASLICELDSGRPGPTLLLNGHTDTVKVHRGDWTKDPYGGEIDADSVWGRGACDMKGGLAALVAATAQFVSDGGPYFGRLVLTATADEDTESYWGLPWLVREGLVSADFAIVAEPAGQFNDFEFLYLASRGYGYAVVEVSAPDVGHSSAYFPSRPHAVAAAARLITLIEQGFRPAPATHPLYQDGGNVVAGEIFHGGDRAGDLPSAARFTVGARLLPGAKAGDYPRELQAFVDAQNGEGLGSEAGIHLRVVEEPLRGGFVDTWAPAMDIDAEHPMVRRAQGWLKDAGYGAEPAGFPGYSEGALLAQAGIPTLPALGPGQLAHYAHRPDERVSVSSLRAAVALYRDLFAQMLGPELPAGGAPG